MSSTLEELRQRRKALHAGRKRVEASLVTMSSVAVIVCSSVVLRLTVTEGLGRWLSGDNLAKIFLAMLLMATFVFGSMVLTVGWLSRQFRERWDRQRSLIAERLSHGRLAEIVLDEAYWEPVYTLMGSEPWLHWTGQQRPQKLAQRIEQTADYWRAALVLEAGTLDELPQAVRSGSRNCRLDNIASVVFSILSLILCLIFLALLTPLIVPLSLPLVNAYIQQRATHIALLDFFIARE